MNLLYAALYLIMESFLKKIIPRHVCPILRVCIEMDVSKTSFKSFWIGMLGAPGDHFQEVFYESYSLFCVKCCRLGHSVSFCKPGTVRKSQGKNGKHVDLEMVLTKQVKKKCIILSRIWGL